MGMWAQRQAKLVDKGVYTVNKSDTARRVVFK